MQRKTWSAHKHRNLVKAMMLVFPDGYILHAESCFFANGANNDAKILNRLLEKDGKDSLRSFMRNGNAMLLDRGFRDSTAKLDQAGIVHFMPAFMDKDMKQISCDQANLSRKVTMGRFVVETVNGRLKKFK